MAAAALIAVAPLETGIVIHDSYTFKQYVSRRVHFLSQHDEYKDDLDLFSVVRRDASFVYLTEYETLSCEEVRRRETDVGFEVLLPLPTTNNMASFSNYALYPDEEWNQDYEHLPGGPSPDPSSSRAASQRSESDDMNLDRLRRDIAAARQLVDPPVETPADRERRMFYESQGMTMPVRKPQPPVGSFDPMLMASIIASLGTYTAPLPTPKQAVTSPDDGEVDAPVAEYDEDAALQARSARPDSPANITKDTAPGHDADEIMATEKDTPTELEDTTAYKTAITEPVGTRKASHSSNRSIVTSPAPPASKRKPSIKQSIARPIRTTRVTKPRAPITKRRGKKALSVTIPSLSGPSESPEYSPIEPTHPLSPIIAGTALPKTKTQALAAQKLLLSRLTGGNKRATSFRPEFHMLPAAVRSSRRKKPAKKVDTKGGEVEFIACVCNSIKEPKTGDWIACDGCDVWQHDACMGAGVPADKEGGKYLCQVCDPWVHRVLIQGLRGEKE